jgi:hypothetical protein
MKTIEFEGREYVVMQEGSDGKKILIGSEDIILLDENGNKEELSTMNIKKE